MKRILVVPTWYPSALAPHVGAFVQEQAALAQAEFDVRALVTSPRPVGRRRAWRWATRRLSGVKVTPEARASSGERPPLMSFAAEFAAWPQAPSYLRSPRVARRIARHLRASDWTPDLIHVHGAISGGLLGRRLASELNVPYVVTEHQHIIFDYFSGADWADAKAVYSGALRVAAVSEFQRQTMLMNGCPADPVVVGNFIDEERFCLSSASPTTGEPELLFIGITSPLKDHPTFLRALRILKDRGRRFTATMVSPDFLGRSALLKQDVISSGLQGVVRLVPSASRDEVVALIHRSRALVSTSVAETFGVAVGEALMCGRPVVATLSGGISDFVEEGRNGYLVRIGDAEALASRLEEILVKGFPSSPEALRASVLHRYGRSAFLGSLRRLYAN